MLENLASIPIRVLVTGTRGKSSLTRLLHTGFLAVGIRARSRITGVLPRELGVFGSERVIQRTSPVHVGEIAWWLKQIPYETQAIIVENSAISPDLQGFAADMVGPTLVVWTTLRADHTEVWGPGREGAARALMRGVPQGVPVVGGAELDVAPLLDLFMENTNRLTIVNETRTTCSHAETNLALAIRAFSLCVPASSQESAMHAMATLSPDIADFRILTQGADRLAVAFSANDRESTNQLFAETGWDPRETTVLFHHRTDRVARLEHFKSWLASHPWREVVFSCEGGRGLPLFQRSSAWNTTVKDAASFRRWWKGKGRVFACGNVSGWPLQLLREVRSL